MPPQPSCFTCEIVVWSNRVLPARETVDVAIFGPRAHILTIPQNTGHPPLPESALWWDSVYTMLWKLFTTFKLHYCFAVLKRVLLPVEKTRKIPILSRYTDDPLQSRTACTQPYNVNTHSRAHCSPGARLCEQWGHGWVNNGARLCASARLCRGSPVR